MNLDRSRKKENSLCSLMFPRNNQLLGRLVIDKSFFQQHIYTSGLWLWKALLPTVITMGGPPCTELLSGIAKKSPSQSFPAQPGVRHSLLGNFLICFLGEASHDSQIGFCLPNKAEIITSKCYYKDKNRFVITVISLFLVNVSLGWYLLLLDFGIQGQSGRGLTYSHTLHCYRKLGCSGKWQPT